MNHLTLKQLARVIDHLAPEKLAASWDNVGLQIGNPGDPARTILVALEVTTQVLDEAREIGADTLVTHHPLIFRPLDNLVEGPSAKTLSLELIRRGISLIAAHTNLDSVAEGTNGELADRLGMNKTGRRFLQPVSPSPSEYKYAVFVPSGHVQAVIEAMARAGAGVIGNYSHCTFRTPGTGTYKPMEGAEPWSGEVGKLEHAEESRIECVCPVNCLGKLIQEVNAAHPYEEVAYDVFPLVPAPEPTAGLGSVGKFEKLITLRDLAARAKDRLDIPSVGIVGDPDQTLKTIAVSTGAGGYDVRFWRPGTADVFVTGEMTHHECAEADFIGLAALLVGHFASEAIVCERFALQIREQLTSSGIGEDVEIHVSRKQRAPVQRI